MNGFLPLSRELLNGSLWTNLSLIEKGLLIELLRITPMRETEYSLYGSQIKLEAYELCFAVKRMAAFLGVTYHCLRRFLDKLENMKLIRKQARHINVIESGTFPRVKTRVKARVKTTISNRSVYTSVIFCGWVFQENWDVPSATPQTIEPHERFGEQLHEHNLNNIIYTGEEEIYRESQSKNETETRTEDNPKIMLDNWQSDPLFTSSRWLSEVAAYSSVDPATLQSWLQAFVRQQQCQGYYFLKQREFQRRFVKFTEYKSTKKQTKRYGTTEKPTHENRLAKTRDEQTKRLDALAAELYGS